MVPIPPLEQQKRIVEFIEKALFHVNIIEKSQTQYASDIKVLRDKLFDAGIQGKLTDQLFDDGTAEELFAEIQEEKARLLKEKKIKKEKPLDEITEEEIPFDIPSNWKW